MFDFELHLLHIECNNDVVTTFGQRKYLILETKLCDFLKILAIWASFPYKTYNTKDLFLQNQCGAFSDLKVWVS